MSTRSPANHQRPAVCQRTFHVTEDNLAAHEWRRVSSFILINDIAGVVVQHQEKTAGAPRDWTAYPSDSRCNGLPATDFRLGFHPEGRGFTHVASLEKSGDASTIITEAL